MSIKSEQESLSNVQMNEPYIFPEEVKILNLTVEWTSPKGILCDLDIVVYLFDERGRTIGKLDYIVKQSNDKSIFLEADKTLGRTVGFHDEIMRIDFDMVDDATAAILLFVDGGVRNFQSVQNLKLTGAYERRNTDTNAFYHSQVSDSSLNEMFRLVARPRKDTQGIAMCAVYRDGKYDTGRPRWTSKCFLETISSTTTREKDERCAALLVEAVPTLNKYRPRLFPTIRSLCTALSSQTLPLLKRKFQRNDGLRFDQFTHVVFRQLAKTHPLILAEKEAAYSIAMLQEMFHQIDYNGDGTVDWDEFTTFCIQSVQNNQPGATAETVLDHYVIEYEEEVGDRDSTLNSFYPIVSMRLIPEMRRLLVVPENADHIFLFDMKFELLAQITPANVKSSAGSKTSLKEATEMSNASAVSAELRPKIVVYDAVFLSGRDLYAYTCSEHAITIVKEQSSAGGRTTNYHIFNRLYHGLLMIKLCWSQRSRVLCSVATDHTIFGWDIDNAKVVFKVSRHEDVITDFLALDEIELYATCSLDKRIVLWNMNTQRVKGVLLGHTRGVRCISYSSGLLLSASFECDARVWDMTTKAVVLFLRGHRFPIAVAKLMCDKAQTEDDHRAITVDDSGEFRVWNVFVKERGGESHFAPTLQVFAMRSPEPAYSRFKFIALPYLNSCSQGNYSDLVACSTKLMHFIPHKNARDFSPPTCILFDDVNCLLVTAVGRSLMKYDMTAGTFLHSFSDIYTSDLTALAMDGKHGRRIFIGANNGSVLLVNFTTGYIINTLQVHLSEVSYLVSARGTRHNIFSSSTDGSLSIVEESSGVLKIQKTFQHCFGIGIGIANFFLVESINALFVLSNSHYWGVWSSTTFKRLMVFSERGHITGLKMIPSTSAPEKEDTSSGQGKQVRVLHSKKLLTLAVALLDSIHIYAVDLQDRSRTFPVLVLSHHSHIQITNISLVDCPRNHHTAHNRNGLPGKLSRLIVACTDDGHLISWDVTHVRSVIKGIYRHKFSKLSRINTAASGRGLAMIATATSSGVKNSLSQSYGGSSDSLQCSSSPSNKEVQGQGQGQGISNHPFFTTEVSGDMLSPDSSDEEEGMSGSRPRSTARGRSRTGRRRTPNHRVSSASGSKSPTPELKRLQSMDLEDKSLSVAQAENMGVISASSLVDEDDIEQIFSISSWKGHVESICGSMPMNEQCCFVTVAFDGFFRVWNVDGECLGELPLPNLTERMRSSLFRLSTVPLWRFVYDQVEVGVGHRELAAKFMMEEHVNGDNDKEDPLHADISRSRRKRSQTHSSRKPSEGIKQHMRDSVLKALVEPLTMPDDAPPARLSQLYEHTSPEPLILSPRSLKSDVSNLSTTVSRIESPKSLHQRSMYSSKEDSHSHSHSHSHSYSPSLSTSQKRISSMDNSVFSHMSLWTSVNDSMLASTLMLPPAFSDASLLSSGRDGLLDNEGHRILLKVANEPGRAKVYDRTMSTLLLRNASLSTSVVMPSLQDMRTAEVHFGPQKDMYKNAEKFLFDKGDLSKVRARDVVTQARIKRNVRKVRTMIHLIPPPSHEEVVLPPGAHVTPGDNDGSSDEGSSQFSLRMRSRLQTSASLASVSVVKPRPLDRGNIAAIMERVQAAESDVPEWEKRFLESDRKGIQTLGKNTSLSISVRALLEKRLLSAIRYAYNDEGSTKEKEKVTLSSKALSPNYKMVDIQHFIEMFVMVDEDGSGELDCDEWIKLFTTLNKSITVKQARLMFMDCDKDASGSIALPELIPIFFDKASTTQQKLISSFIDSEVNKEHSKKNVEGLSVAELKKLFRCYDHSGLGFIRIGLIRERIKAMQLPVNALVQAMNTLKDMEDDEMVNHLEFVTLLQPYSR